jgi:hypothetical protein
MDFFPRSCFNKILYIMLGICKCCYTIFWKNAANRLSHIQTSIRFYFYAISSVVLHSIYVFILSEISGERSYRTDDSGRAV